MAAPKPDEVARRLIILKYEMVQVLATPPVLRETVAKLPPADQQKVRAKLQEAAEKLATSFRGVGVWEFMTDKEVQKFSTHPLDLTTAQVVDISWRMESVMVLMWALGIIPEVLPYDEQTNTELLKQIPHENVSSFFLNAQLRNAEMLENSRSLAELWHWRSRTRQLIEENRPFPAEIPQSKSYDEIVRLTAKGARETNTLEVIDEDFGTLGKAYRDLSDDEWSGVRSIATERHHALNWLCGHAPGNNWDKTPTDT